MSRAHQSSVDWPIITEHAADRWHDRASNTSPAIGPRVAWNEGQRLPDTHSVRADEVRYHDATKVALLRKNNAIVTVISVDVARLPLRRAIARVDDDVRPRGGRA